MIHRPIHHTFGPHVTPAYVRQSLRYLLSSNPFHTASRRYVEDLETNITAAFGLHTTVFDSGRSALTALLQAAGIQAGDEVVVQGYTCMVVPNAIQAAGALPVYADIDADSLNLTPDTVEPVLTNRTRAVVCQHTFGIPADVQLLRDLCERHGILLIEDCAHVLPDDTDPDVLRGSQAAIVSFGRDKALSAVTGGAALVQDHQLHQALQQQKNHAPVMTGRQMRRYLRYPLHYLLARPGISLGIGKAYLRLLRAVGELPPVLLPTEKSGTAAHIQQLPDSLARLGNSQLSQLQRINDHRRQLTTYYLEEATRRQWSVPPAIRADLPLQKFPLLTKQADEIRRTLKKQHIYLDDGWTGAVICPRSCSPAAAGYAAGACPVAESTGSHILCLPTHPTMSLSQARNLVQILDSLLR